MNRTTAIIGGVVAVLIVGGLILYSVAYTNQGSTVATSTDSTGTTPVGQAQTPGAALAVTNSNVAPADTTAIVSGRVTPNGAFTSYWYEYGTTGNLGNKTPNQSIGSGYSSTLAPGYITGLVKDTNYFFRLVAQNQYGTVAGGTYTFATTHGAPMPVGSAPAIQTTSANGITKITANVNGTVLPNRASTTFWFEYGKTADLGSVSAFESVGDGNSTLAAFAALTDLNPATVYYFRIDAQNQFGTVTGAVLTFKTAGPALPAPSAPAAVTNNASGVTSSGAVLHGSVNPNNLDTTYWFEYSTDSLLSSVVRLSTDQTSAGAGNNSLAVSANISGLVHATTYYVRLVAQNNQGTTEGARLSFKTK